VSEYSFSAGPRKAQPRKLLPYFTLNEEEAMTSTEWEARWKAKKEATRDEISNKLEKVWETLTEIGCLIAEVEYDGYGDSGQMNGVDLYTEGQGGSPYTAPGDFSVLKLEKPIIVDVRDTYAVFVEGEGWVDRVREGMELTSLLEDIASDIVEIHAPGFENNDGGRGVVVFQTKEKILKCEHEQYYTSSDHSEYVFGNKDASV